MSDAVKLIIEIPKKTVAHIRSDYGHGCKAIYIDDKDIIVDAIYNAIPFDDVKTEIESNYREVEFMDAFSGGCNYAIGEVLEILNSIGRRDNK